MDQILDGLHYKPYDFYFFLLAFHSAIFICEFVQNQLFDWNQFDYNIPVFLTRFFFLFQNNNFDIFMYQFIFLYYSIFIGCEPNYIFILYKSMKESFFLPKKEKQHQHLECIIV